MSKLKRHSYKRTSCLGFVLISDENGGLVLYVDAQAALDAKDKEIERLKKVGEEDSYRYGFAVADIQRLREALGACVDVMQHLPTLNGLYGLAVLENAKQALAQTAGHTGEANEMKPAQGGEERNENRHCDEVCNCGESIEDHNGFRGCNYPTPMKPAQGGKDE